MSQPPYQQYPYAQPAPIDANRVAYLEQRLAAVEGRLPNTALLTGGFFARCFAVWGYSLVANIIISLIVGVALTILGIILAAVFGMSLAAMIPALQGSMGGY